MQLFYFNIRQFLSSIFLLFVFSLNTGFAQTEGEKIFKQSCATCHRTDGTKLVGPGLKGVTSRVPQPAEEWMFKWIKNNVALQKSGDVYANKIFNDNGKVPMLVFEGVLSDENIKAVIEYLKNPPAEKVVPVAKNVNAVASQPQKKGVSVVYILFIATVVLIILVGILAVVQRSLRNSINLKKGIPPSADFGFVKWASRHKRIVALVGILLVATLARAIYVGLMNIGVYDNYKPVQPILFSHKTHAGKLNINCVYCHSGAEKGKTAGVPSANVCMNCHKAISSGPLTGTTEIAKLYDAVGFNLDKRTYDETKQHPIKWVRVHALADFVYFNHSQHVVVGKQACQNCHGDLTTTDVAQQNKPLTMGWCINCHRQTEVPGMNSNPYYVNLHKKLSEKYKGQPITVEKMGGTDCIKCHY
ncbi:MAG TPA: c-type cytochrome [Bacteroidia bacterium]